MAEPKHDPGPWAYDPELNRVYSVPTNMLVATAWLIDNPTADPAWPANARLIAAAPEVCDALADCLRMLEAVRYSAGLGKGQMERVAKAKAALAKATGEGG